MFLMTKSKYRNIFRIIICVIFLIIIGIIIPKLTVHNLVMVDERINQCAILGVNQHLDNLFERTALLLGESRITRTDNNGVEVQSFTLFRIPLGVLRGQPDMKLSVFCNPGGDPSAIQVLSNPRFEEWATYSVDVPAFTDDSRGDHFSFEYPKSEYIQLDPDMFGRLLRFQNYDPNEFSRDLEGKYSLEFFIDTEGHISCEQNVANAETVTNSQDVTMQKGQARQSEESGSGAVGIAVCIERQDYILYLQGSDHTGEDIVEHVIDSINFQD